VLGCEQRFISLLQLIVVEFDGGIEFGFRFDLR
jgi:hypothetical protein